MRILTLLTIVFFFFSTPAIAGAGTAEIVRKNTKIAIDNVISTLKNTKISKKARRKKILDIVNPIFDFKKMAKISLGKKYWKSFTKDQQKEFVTLFVKRLQESYLEKLDLYTDEKVLVNDATFIKKRIWITTELVSKDDKKEMIYKFSQSKKTKKWLVYDVEIMGVSVVQTYRSQFKGVLKKESVEKLLERLRKTGQFNVPSGSDKD